MKDPHDDKTIDMFPMIDSDTWDRWVEAGYVSMQLITPPTGEIFKLKMLELP